MPGTTAPDVTASTSSDVSPIRQELVVAWQHPVERTIYPVGLLRSEAGRYSFRYVAQARSIPDFRPLLGFADLTVPYFSEYLFPLFAQRAMDPRRPDFVRYVTGLGLDPDTATPWEQITRSRGRRQGDTLQLFPVPRILAGVVSCTFLIHGTRHIPVNEPELNGRVHRVRADELEHALRSARAGDPLDLVPEPENPKNPEAVVVMAAGTPLGYVPDLLVHDLGRLTRQAPVSATIVRVNGPDAPPHLRVLAELRASGVEGFRFFQGARWQPLA